MKVWDRDVLVSHVTKSVKLLCCRVTVLMPPHVSPMSVTDLATVDEVRRPLESVIPTEPSMEIKAPSTGRPLSSTVMERLEELVN